MLNQRLYVWEDVFASHTAEGVAFALASSADEARSLIRENIRAKGLAACCDVSDLDREPKLVDKPFGFALPGGG